MVSNAAHSGFIGRSLRERRRTLGLTQSRLAATLGVTTSELGGWERDEGRPTVEHARALGRILQADRATAEWWAAESSIKTPATRVAPVTSPQPDLRVVDTGVRNALPIIPDEEANRPRPPGGDPFGDRGVNGAAPIDRNALVRGGKSGVVKRQKRTSRFGGHSSRKQHRQGNPKRIPPVEVPTGDLPVRVPIREARRPMPAPVVARPGRIVADPLADTSVFPGLISSTREQAVFVPYLEDPKQRALYKARLVFVILALAALGIALLWAFGELTDRWSAVVDLFGSTGDGGSITDSFGTVTVPDAIETSGL